MFQKKNQVINFKPKLSIELNSWVLTARKLELFFRAVTLSVSMRVRRSVLGPILVACTKRFITQPHAASVSSAPGSGDIGPVSNSAQTSAAQQELEATAAPKLNLQHLQNRMAMASAEKNKMEKNKMNSNMKGGSWFRAQTGRSADEQPIIFLGLRN